MTERPDYFGDMRKARPRWNVEHDKRKAQRGELHELLVKSGRTSEQADNVVGACIVNGTLGAALEAARCA